MTRTDTIPQVRPQMEREQDGDGGDMSPDRFAVAMEVDDDRGSRVERRVYFGEDARVMRALCEAEDVALIEDDETGEPPAVRLDPQTLDRFERETPGDLPF
jgi:hypothetical protein